MRSGRCGGYSSAKSKMIVSLRGLDRLFVHGGKLSDVDDLNFNNVQHDKGKAVRKAATQSHGSKVKGIATTTARLPKLSPIRPVAGAWSKVRQALFISGAAVKSFENRLPG